MTSGELLREFRSLLTEAGIEFARHEAALLMSQRSHLTLAQIYSHPEQSLEPEIVMQLRNDIKRRLLHEPIAYIIGSAEFFGLPFVVGPGVLIPRADTERLVETAIGQVRANFGGSLSCQQPVRILDTCTGSGCVGLAVALTLADLGFLIELTLVEADAAAASFTQRNLEILLKDPARTLSAKQIKARLVIADLWPDARSDLAKFDLITANPPYISQPVLSTLDPDVADYEPHQALDGGVDGLDYYHRIVAEAPLYLANKGLLLFEHGFDQAAALYELFTQAHYANLILVNDYGGHPRVTGGWKLATEDKKRGEDAR